MAKVLYCSAVGSLMYAMICTRPDIAYAVGVVSRYMSNPGKKHWEAVKGIMRYLNGTRKMCICFGSKGSDVEGYTDADYAGDMDKRRSTLGYVFMFTRGVMSWQSYRVVHLCSLLRQSTLQQQRHARKLFGLLV